jgi:protein-disulfide isomerase
MVNLVMSDRIPAIIRPALCVVTMMLVVSAASAQTNDDVAKKLNAIEASQSELLKQIAALQKQVADLTARFVAITTPPERKETPVPTAPISISGAAKKGSKDAQIAIVEFSDFQCPYCGRFFKETLPEVQKTYVATGKAVIAFRHLPLSNIHPFALKAAQAAECANQQGKFWEMHDSLFADQQHLDAPDLSKRAKTLGLDMEKFDACTAAGPSTGRVQQDQIIARGLQLSATPAFLIGTIQADGSVKVAKVIPGAQPFAVFKGVVDGLLAAPK